MEGARAPRGLATGHAADFTTSGRRSRILLDLRFRLEFPGGSPLSKRWPDGGSTTLIDLDATEVARCKRGDVDALAALHDAFADPIYRTCLGLLGQPADAEDAMQEVLLRILDKAREFSGRSRFSTWVYRLTVNHALNFRRRRSRHAARVLRLGEHEPAADGGGPEAGLDAAEDREALDRALQQLSPEHRAVLVLREIEGLSYDDIAAALEVPAGTVMSRLSRARAALLRHTEPLREHPAPPAASLTRSRHGM